MKEGFGLSDMVFLQGFDEDKIDELDLLPVYARHTKKKGARCLVSQPFCYYQIMQDESLSR